MFQFSENAVVALKTDEPGLDLDAGTTGVIWALYTTTPPSYEVTFEGKDGRKFDVTMAEDELVAVPVPRDLAGSASRFA